MAGVAVSENISLRAKVTAIDLGIRMVTLIGSQLRSQMLKVGDGARSLAQVKPGNTETRVSSARISWVI
jgi:hypothetical protein